MSYITNIILTGSALLEDDEQEIQELNHFLDNSGHFTRVEQDIIGSKAFEMTVYLAAVNYLDEPGLYKAISSLKWTDSESMQLFISRQDEDIFLDQCETAGPGPEFYPKDENATTEYAGEDE